MRKAVFQEKLACYHALIEAYQNAVADSNETNSQKFTYWHKRTEIIAPSFVTEIISKFYDARSGEQIQLREELIKAMRKDLRF